MVTMAPLAARSGSSAARANRNVAVRLTSMTRRQSASVRRRSGTRCMMPALATSPSSRPNFSVTAVMARAAVSSSATSPSMSTTLREALENARARPALGRSRTPTRHPESSRWRATARPMPLAAPVTSATRCRDGAMTEMHPTIGRNIDFLKICSIAFRRVSGRFEQEMRPRADAEPLPKLLVSHPDGLNDAENRDAEFLRHHDSEIGCLDLLARALKKRFSGAVEGEEPVVHFEFVVDRNGTIDPDDFCILPEQRLPAGVLGGSFMAEQPGIDRQDCP